LKADHSLDVRGRPCPIPLIMLKKKIIKINKGEILEVIAESLVVKENIERYANEKKIDVSVEEENELFKIYIKK
jgi:TusA-related sulfurtransferase